jgi:hypothetical protein
VNNEVTIVVKARNETRLGFAEAKAEAHRVGGESGDRFRTGFSGKLLGWGEQIGGKLSEGLSTISEKLPGVMSNAVGSLPPQGQAVAVALVAGLVVSFAPMLAAALSAAVLLAVGGGVLVAGIMAAAKSPKVVAAFKSFQDTAKSVLSDFAHPFIAPLGRAMQTFKGVLNDIRPAVKNLGEIIAPVIDKLAPALGQFLKNMMPGITAAVKASVPLFKTLADKLPVIGEAMSSFFSDIAKSGPETTQFFSDLIMVIAGLIIVLGKVIGWLAHMYTAWRRAFLAMETVSITWQQAILNMFGVIISAAVRAFGWIPGLGPKLKAAGAKFEAFRVKANAELDAIKRRITVHVVYQRSITGPELLDESGHRVGGYRASGGVVGQAATGGARGGLTWVGERGPELVALPPGSAVSSHGDSMRAATGGGGQVDVVLHAAPGASRDLVQTLLSLLRYEIRAQGGNVQQVLGVAGR